MARVISIHEYDLRPDADEAAFERAIRNRGVNTGHQGGERTAENDVWI
jgi:hypothetical protein